MACRADCVFCKIVAVEIPAAVVFENDAALGFLDINPLAEGHLLLIPREHYETIMDMPPEEVTRLFAALPVLGRALMEVTGAEGFNVLQNNGRVSGQVVPHVHFHLIPRRSMDDLGYRWHPQKYAPGRTEEIAAAYQRALSQSP